MAYMYACPKGFFGAFGAMVMKKGNRSRAVTNTRNRSIMNGGRLPISHS